MLDVQHLCAAWGSGFQLRDLSFRLAPGELLAILGPNGSGKSSLLRLLLGLEPPRGGTISWCGQILSTAGKIVVPPEQRAMGVLFQEGVLFPHLRVRDNVALGLQAVGSGRQQVDQALRAMRIERLADQQVQRLSGGEQQRVALARALVQRPRLLLLDEPFHSLDATVKRDIIAELRALIQQQAIATVFVTHDIQEAASLSDAVVLLRDGSKVQQGTIEELYRQPTSRWAAAFLGELESLEVRQARLWGVELNASELGDRVWFRREDLELEPGDGASAEIVAVRRSGAFVDAQVRWPDGSLSMSRTRGTQPLAVGARVKARLVAWLPRQLEGEETE